MVRPESQAIVPMIEEAVVRQDVLPMNLLVVDDEQYVRQLCADVAVQSGMKVTAVSTAEEVIYILENSAVDILMTDLKLPKSSELDLLQRVHDKHREVAVIVLTQYGIIRRIAARGDYSGAGNENARNGKTVEPRMGSEK